MTVGLERWARELTGADLSPEQLARLLGVWEDLLTLVVDPSSPRVAAAAPARALLPKLVAAGGMEPAAFWKLARGQRSRWFLSRYSRNSRDVAKLEISAFDLDKAAKERFRREPLTLGAAWHYGLWRSYFSHAAITHPANDGLREEFSTAWDLVRKEPAVLFREAGGVRTTPLSSVRLDMPILVGPLPITDGHTLETAYLKAVRATDPEHDLKTRTLVVMRAADYLANREALSPYAEDILPRFTREDLVQLRDEDPAWIELLARAPVAEIVWYEGFENDAAWLRQRWPHLLLSVYLRYFGGFWAALAETVRVPGVAVVQVHAAELKSYRLIPRVDAFLKDRLDRARVQLVSVGGDGDTISSAAAVYEAVLLGANGGAATHLALLSLAPEFADVLGGAAPEPYLKALAERGEEDLYQEAVNTLSCWQHSILDFLSCMGIDDVQKTSGNTMAITITEDWAREIDALATAEFAATNRELNARRLADEPVPADVRRRYQVTSLLQEVKRGIPMVHAGRIQEQHTANWHLMNLNRSLTGDFLAVAYRMAAGEMPRVEDFFLSGDMGSFTLDGVRLKLSPASLEWSLDRLRRDPTLLDYVQLAVPRGFHRPGAAAPGARCSLRAVGGPAPVPHGPTGNGGGPDGALASWSADRRGGFELRVPESAELAQALAADAPLEMVALGPDGEAPRVTPLTAAAHGGHGLSIVRASADGAVVLKRHPAGGYALSGLAVREPVWQAPIAHASISLGAASEDFLVARIEGNAGLAMVSSGEGGPIRLSRDEDMSWESMQAASGHFGIHAADLRRVRDVEIKINQGAKPGKGGRLAGTKVTPQVSRARNIPEGTDALSPDPKHDIYSIEDMPAEVWLWLLYHTHCGIKITGSNYTRYVAAGMWSNFVVDYLLVDAGLGGSGNYHADSSHVGWPDSFRTILHTHHALVGEKVDLDGSGKLRSIRDANGVPFGATGGTRLFASGGLRGELDFLKVLIAGADGVVVASIDKAVAFGCNQCGNCHLDCPRGGITTKAELTCQNDREVMRDRFRNWIALSLVKLAVLVDALNHESGALDDNGMVRDRARLLRDIRELRGRVDLVEMPSLPERTHGDEPVRRADSVAAVEHDSCRVGSLTVSEPVDVEAIWEAARLSYNGGNNRGGGIGFAGFAPAAVAGKTCFILNTIGPDRADTARRMLDHFEGCRFFDAAGEELALDEVRRLLPEFRIPVRDRYAGEEGWRKAGLRENVGDFTLLFVEMRPDTVTRYAQTLLASAHWLQRRTRFGDLSDEALLGALEGRVDGDGRLAEFPAAVREEYFSVLAHLLDSRYYRTHGRPGAPAHKYADKRRGFVVSLGEDLGAIKISGWTHVIPEYFDCARFWAGYPGAAERGGVEVTRQGRMFRTTALYAHSWGMHHRYPTNSPAIDPEGRGNPAGAHPFKAYNVLLMHNGEQVGVDSTAPFLAEYGTVHPDESMGPGALDYAGDSLYERKALTDTEYAAYLVDFTRRVLGLGTEEATQIISPITGLDLAHIEEPRRSLYKLLATNYVQLTPTGPYKFTILETRPGGRVGFRENMDIKFLRPHEVIVHRDEATGGVKATANGSEAKIADSMLRVLHQQGVLGDAAADLRFNMRPGGRPGHHEFGGVVEAFVRRGTPELELNNRFGEPVPVPRSGLKVDLAVPLGAASGSAASSWRGLVDERLDQAARAAEDAAKVTARAGARLFGPEDDLPALASELVESTLERVASLSFGDYRYLVEDALPSLAADGDVERALAIRVLVELRKRLVFADLGGKALSSMEYLTDGGRARDGSPEGGLYRVLDTVPAVADSHGRSRHLRLAFDTRDDLVEPADPGRDVLVVDFRHFESATFDRSCATRLVTEAARLGWRNFLGYGFIGGPRYVGTNLVGPDGGPARDVVMEFVGREFGDFLGALLEGGRIYVYGQGQSHAGFKADSGRLFILQDALNTCAYAAHGFTFSAWDTGSRFGVAGQNKVTLSDDSPAPGFQSIHMGSPNEYAFEYLMSGGDNSCHVVLGLAKPDRHGQLAQRTRPYSGKFFMSGAAAGRLFLLDPARALEREQYRGNVAVPISSTEWTRDVAPLINTEARLRGAPVRAGEDHFEIRLGDAWMRWPYQEAFLKLIPSKVAAKMIPEPTPEGLVQIVGE